MAQESPFTDMPAEEFRKAGHEIVDWIADYLADPRRHPIMTGIAPGDLIDKLPAHAPARGEPFDAIFRDFQDLIVPSSTLWNHPRFFNFFSVSTSGPGILAEALIATLNMNGMIWKSSPAVTELEQVTLGWLRDWLGLPGSFFGIIHDTASLATMHAILAARTKADPAIRTEGSSPGMVLYTSEQAHSSVEKGALALGIGQRYVRKIGLDSAYRMRPELLRQAIAEDRAAGLRPFCAVATVGTTATTAIDPVPAIAAICEEQDLWLHVDGAYGGHAGLVPEYRAYLDGCARADSFVVNPHKWLFTPIDLSAFYTRHPQYLRQALSLVPSYLQSAENPRALNYMDYSIALGRRFRALKLWFVMRYFGQERIVAIVRHHIEMARELAQRIEADPRFELAAPTPLSLVCFRLKAGDQATGELLARIDRDRTAFLGQTVLDGRLTIRWAIGNIHTTQHDLDETWALLQRSAG
ncbi:MAG: amino acid decarboxylase [Bryobacterales bacterium]|nr:amino acid decarboxylase [Bryobacterales bacterium]